MLETRLQPADDFRIETDPGHEQERTIGGGAHGNPPYFSPHEGLRGRFDRSRDSDFTGEDVHRAAGEDSERRFRLHEAPHHFVQCPVAAPAQDSLDTLPGRVSGDLGRVARSLRGPDVHVHARARKHREHTVEHRLFGPGSSGLGVEDQDDSQSGATVTSISSRSVPQSTTSASTATTQTSLPSIERKEYGAFAGRSSETR